MAPAGLSAVLRSRQTNSLASQGSFTVAALRGTCSYPWRSAQCVSNGATILFFGVLVGEDTDHRRNKGKKLFITE